jgi:hypothetical protein
LSTDLPFAVIFFHSATGTFSALVWPGTNFENELCPRRSFCLSTDLLENRLPFFLESVLDQLDSYVELVQPALDDLKVSIDVVDFDLAFTGVHITFRSLGLTA